MKSNSQKTTNIIAYTYDTLSPGKMQYHLPAWRSVFVVSELSRRKSLRVDESGYIHYRDEIRPVFPPPPEANAATDLLWKYMNQLSKNLKEQIGQKGQEKSPDYFPSDFPVNVFSRENWELVKLEPELHETNREFIKAWRAVLRLQLPAFSEVIIGGETLKGGDKLPVEDTSLTVSFGSNRVKDFVMASPVVQMEKRSKEPLKIALEFLKYLTSGDLFKNLDLGFSVEKGKLRVGGRRDLGKKYLEENLGEALPLTSGNDYFAEIDVKNRSINLYLNIYYNKQDPKLEINKLRNYWDFPEDGEKTKGSHLVEFTDDYGETSVTSKWKLTFETKFIGYDGGIVVESEEGNRGKVAYNYFLKELKVKKPDAFVLFFDKGNQSLTEDNTIRLTPDVFDSKSRTFTHELGHAWMNCLDSVVIDPMQIDCVIGGIATTCLINKASHFNEIRSPLNPHFGETIKWQPGWVYVDGGENIFGGPPIMSYLYDAEDEDNRVIWLLEYQEIIKRLLYAIYNTKLGNGTFSKESFYALEKMYLTRLHRRVVRYITKDGRILTITPDGKSQEIK
ncbi:MAG: hypothetical protein K1X92_15760 [Bacteroidia bacterium]|nr:hypothetical protein [Bacteroidia bacterium]